MAVLWTVVWKALESEEYGLGIPVSRRTTNATFVAWIIALNTILLAAMEIILQVTVKLLSASSTSYKRVLLPPASAAVNRQGLVAFVFANLLTGVVNLSIDTLAVSDNEGLGILFVYLSAVGGFALLLNYFWPGRESSTPQAALATKNGSVKSKKS